MPAAESRPWWLVSIFRLLLFLSSFALLSLYVLRDLSSIRDRSNRSGLDVSIVARQASSSVLKVFQVHEPVLTPVGPSDQNGCVYAELLMEHSFAFSYGRPFVGQSTQLSVPRPGIC